jgi:hypothetical protein
VVSGVRQERMVESIVRPVKTSQITEIFTLTDLNKMVCKSSHCRALSLEESEHGFFNSYVFISPVYFI